MIARKLTVTVLVSLCMLVGLLALSIAPASGAVLPEVETSFEVSGRTPTMMTVQGTVNPEGVPVTACQFEYGPDLNGKVSYSQSVPCAPSPGSGNTAVTVTATLTGLEPSGLYFYRLSATNANGTSRGQEDYSFLPPAVEEVSTGPAEELSNNAAKLTGSLAPDGTDARYYFEYGTSTAYGSTSPALPGTDAGTGGPKCEPPGGPECSPVAVASTIGSLAENTTYHYRLVAVNAIGVSVGQDRQFRTFGLPQVQAEAEVKPAEQAGQTSATLKAQIDPEGPETTYRFEYGETTSYGNSIPIPDGTVGAGQEFVSVPTSEPSNLKIGTTYHYRVVASNVFGTTKGPDQQFKTLPAVLIEQDSAAEVAATSASLRARINPLGYDTHYYFQWGVTGFTSSVPAPPGIDLGSGEASLPVSVHLQGLAAGTTYHYRLVAVNEAGGKLMTVESPDQTFTTQGAGTEVTQPDGRQWEMVTPPNKQGAEIFPLGEGEKGDTIQAAADGSGIAYGTGSSLVANPAGNRAPEVVEGLSLRLAPGNWSVADLFTPHNEGGLEQVGFNDEYLFFSQDLSLGLLQPLSKTSLPPLTQSEEAAIYLRDASGKYQPVGTSADLQTPGELLREGIYFLAASPDLSHVVVESTVQLTPAPLPEGQRHVLYEWNAGHWQLVSVLPDHESTSAQLGTNGFAVRRALSDSGTRVIWTGPSSSSGSTPGRLYLRDMRKGETIAIDAAQGTPEPEARGSSMYQISNSEGSRIFFTSRDRLTADSSAEGEREDLYEFELTSGDSEPLAGRLVDLTVDRNPGETADLQGVMGTSDDGSEVYFVANGVLGDGAARGARPGDCGSGGETQCNLYEVRYDETTKTWMQPHWIAALSGADAPTWGSEDRLQDLIYMTSRVSPNGRYLAFMSEHSLTGYDNRDANGGVPDEEVFLYDAHTQKLVCASCNPTGGRPAGVFASGILHETLVDYTPNWPGRWLAASIPGWTPNRDTNYGSFYQSRYLSNDGRLFFDGGDSLVPADVNGKEDVYEYEPAGVGSCQNTAGAQSGSVVYNTSAGGCVGLISSGTSSGESVFMDASESGGDVFFLTLSKLASKDYDTALDIYDAHECTAAAPCAPPSPLTPPPCTTGDACKAAPTPQPTLYAEPSSETFAGAGNIVPAAAQPKVTSKSSSEGAKRAKALKACRRLSKRKRVPCERRARTKYGAKQSHAKAAHGQQRSGGRKGR